MNLVQRLWADEAGFIVSSEMVLIASIAVLGMIVGLSTVRDQVTGELADVANAVGTINQSYSYSGLTGHSSSVAGTDFTDALDFCDGVQPGGTFANCIAIVACTNE